LKATRNSVGRIRAPSLLEVARRLRNPRVDKIASSYREGSIALRRVIFLTVCIAWMWSWIHASTTQPDGVTLNILPLEAANVFWWLIGGYLVSIVWLFVVRRLGDQHVGDRIDAAGAIANHVGIFGLLSLSWNLMIWTITFLPLASIAIGARFSRRAFITSTIGSVAVVGFAAPPHYWITRPAFGAFALVLLVGLPLTVNRLLSALYEISLQAIDARDGHRRLVATVSHELRTPLNSIIIACGFINPDDLDGEKRRLLDVVTTNADALSHRISEVLDVAVMDGGRLQLVSEPFRFTWIMETVEKMLSSQANAKGVALTTELRDASNATLIGDAGRIEQILSNLASNAIKFTPHGGTVDVCVTVEQGEHHADILCEVKDTGVGIPDDQKTKVFEPFHQVSSGARRHHGGVGLGLHIARSFSDMMRGALTITDNSGGGTIFAWRVRLPMGASGALHRARTSVFAAFAEHRQRIRQLRCLIIDDNPSNREMLSMILERAGHVPTLVEDGSSGLVRATQEPFDAILLDLHMPVISGWEFLTQYRDQGLRAPVVVLSADADSEVIEKVKAFGAVGYITKPIAIQRILAQLAEIAGDRPGLDCEATHAANADLSTGLNWLIATGDLEGTSSFVLRCFDGIKRGFSMLTDLIRSGVSRDDKRVVEALHGLKNEFLNLGFLEGASACDRFRSASSANITVALEQLSALRTEIERRFSKHVLLAPSDFRSQNLEVEG
jgi:signal transduction histidine kinase/CheY-like chemotaxis protein